MPAVANFAMTYYALNQYRTFSEGDTITGLLTLNLEKQTEVKSLFVKAKGDASVHWTERSSTITTYSTHRRIFKLKQFLIQGEAEDIVLPPGSHVFKFSFKIPLRSMPSSFRGSHGKVVYKLEAKLSRSWRMDCTVEKEITFVSKAIPNIHHLMSHQSGSTDKQMGVFSKGCVHMDVIVDRRAYAPGETMVVVAKVNNSSSKEMTPKFSFIQHVEYRANGHTKHESDVICKKRCDCIKPNTQMEVTCAIKIPPDQVKTIQNCDIMSVKYCVKVYLDISFSFDPEVLFPVVIVPHDLASSLTPSGGPHPAGATGGPSNSDFPPPGAHLSSSGYPTVQGYTAPPPSYPTLPGTSRMYPAQTTHMSGGYNNPVPRQPYPFITSPTAAANNHAPAMNTDLLSQSDEAPPSYSLLFPSPATENSDAK